MSNYPKKKMEKCFNVFILWTYLDHIRILLIVGHIDHSERVMRVITWNRSFRGAMNGENRKGEFVSDESETHATILDKLLAWEKKLYDEVKVHFRCWLYCFSVQIIRPAACHDNL